MYHTFVICDILPSRVPRIDVNLFKISLNSMSKLSEIMISFRNFILNVINILEVKWNSLMYVKSA